MVGESFLETTTPENETQSNSKTTPSYALPARQEQPTLQPQTSPQP